VTYRWPLWVDYEWQLMFIDATLREQGLSEFQSWYQSVMRRWYRA
jgi:hypothetical protein